MASPPWPHQRAIHSPYLSSLSLITIEMPLSPTGRGLDASASVSTGRRARQLGRILIPPPSSIQSLSVLFTMASLGTPKPATLRTCEIKPDLIFASRIAQTCYMLWPAIDEVACCVPVVVRMTLSHGAAPYIREVNHSTPHTRPRTHPPLIFVSRTTE